MVKEKQILEKSIGIRRFIMSYVIENMKYNFIKNMSLEIGSTAIFITAKGLKVKFESHGYDGFEQFVSVETEGRVNNKSFCFNDSSYIDYHFDETIKITILSDNYGIDLKVDKKDTIIKPFRNILGRKVYLFANNAINEILPLIEEFSKDIETITPDEKTKLYIKTPKDYIEEEKRKAKLEADEELEKLMFDAIIKSQISNSYIRETDSDSPHTLKLVQKKS